MKTHYSLISGSVLYFIFLGLSFFSSSLPAQAPSFNFRALTDNEGLSDGVVHDFTADKYGFIWIATSYGLNW
ncbi:MAG TPA: two-component regulator propeller domain-containing protein, partial [Saprospiraceae bacterium]|nr:two-component regulator propeller domain-containing protein [Saprospiraceae bacterium]